MSDLYRLNVGIVVFNNTGKVLLCARADQKGKSWQFPQGGIEKGEDIVGAARRELFEETGIKDVELVTVMPQTTCYDFPSHVKFGKFKGQEQHWVLFYFTGNDKDINLQINPREIEFKDYKWSSINEAPKLIVEFKKKVYNQVVDCFDSIIKDFLQRKTNGV